MERTPVMFEQDIPSQVIIEAAPVLTYVFDVQKGSNIYVSPQVQTILGYCDAEIQAMGNAMISLLMHPEDAGHVAQTYENLLECPSNEFFEVEYRMRHKSGAWVWLWSRDCVLKRDADGKPLLVLGVATDISARWEVQDALRKSEASKDWALQRFQLAEAAANGFSFEWDLRSGTIIRSAGLKEILGYEADEVPPTYEGWWHLVHPDDRPAFVADAEIVEYISRQPNAGFSHEYRLLHKGGQYRWLHERAIVMCGDDGQPLRVIGQTVDITEMKQADQALRLSEERFRAVQETSIDGFMILESVRDAASAIVDFRWIYTNAAAERIIGRPNGWFAGRRLLEEMPGNRVDGIFDAYVRVVQTGAPWTSEFEYKHEGLNVYIRLVAAKAGDGFAVSFADLSERRKSEERIAASEQRFRDLANAMPQIVWTNEASGRVNYFNSQWLDYTGLSLEESLQDSNAPVHPDDRRAAESAWTNNLQTAQPFEYELRIRRHDGAYRWFLARCVPSFDKAGQRNGWYGTSTDIHDIKLNEEALRASEAQFRTLSESLPDMLWIADASGRPLYQNPAWRKFIGMTSDEIAAKGFAWLHHPDEVNTIMKIWAEARHAGQPFSVEMRMRRHDGEYRWCSGRTAPVKDGSGNVIRWIGTIIDVHERRQEERNTQFLADLGAHFSQATDPQALMWQVVEASAQHFGISRAAFASFDSESLRITVFRDVHAGVPSIAGNYPQWWLPSEFLDLLNRGETISIHDLMADARTSAIYQSTFKSMGLRALVAMPLLRNGRCAALLFMADHQPRNWTSSELDMLRMVADRTWLAVESNRVHFETQMLNAILETRITERTRALEQSHEQLKQLTAYVERAREDERTRIAQDVHDQLGGALTVLKMSLAQITKRLDVKGDMTQRLDDFKLQIDELVRVSRRISYDLRPSMLDDFGLFAAMEWQGREWERRTGIVCTLRLPDVEVHLDRAGRTAIFRVFQEALTNVARHAAATEVIVTAQVQRHGLTLSISDNGNGISHETLQNIKSLGLMGMRERMREIAGDLEIRRRTEGGTIVSIHVPLDQEMNGA
jgi:PAS domain S-box-containing protein